MDAKAARFAAPPRQEAGEGGRGAVQREIARTNMEGGTVKFGCRDIGSAARRELSVRVAALWDEDELALSQVGPGKVATLSWAAEHGHTGVAKMLLDAGAGVGVSFTAGSMRGRKPLYHGTTPLHWAARNGHTGVGVMLLDAGADVSAARNNDGATPLHWAAEHDHGGMAKMLLDAGADVTERSKTGISPLHFAAGNGSVTNVVARMLLDAGADAGVRCDEGTTPLHWAVEEGCEAVRMLLDAGADAGTKSNGGTTPLHWALKSKGRGENESDEMMTEGGHNRTTYPSAKPPPKVAFSGAGVRILLDAGADCNAPRGGDQATPLHLAARNGVEKVAKMLLDAGADAGAVTSDGATPLHWAAEHAHAPLVRLLLDAGADGESKDNAGNTPADRAALSRSGSGLPGHRQVVALLAAARGGQASVCAFP